MAALFPDPGPPALPPLAWDIPAASRRDAAAGFFVIARWAAAPMAAPAAPDVLSGAEVGWVPARERRSGLDVKYLQERARDDSMIGDATHG